MTSKTLILLGGIDWLGQSMQASGLVDVASIYKLRNKITKPIFKLQYHTNFLYHYRDIWYGEWKKHLDQYHTVIIFDVFEDIDIIEYIQRKFPRIRIVVYYYNPVYNRDLLNKIILTGVEIWSFDFSDCKKYSLMYNPQFYFRNIVFWEDSLENINFNTDAYDLIFVGKDKGRMPLLMKLNAYLRRRKINFFMGICPDRNTTYSNDNRKFFIKNIPYNDYLKYLRKSRCVLDIVQEKQSGLTLRIMEALFYNKKIVTNNIAIQDMKIYDKHNIYILGLDTRDLVEFIKDPVNEWSEEIKNRYVFSEWLKRFFDSNRATEGL